MIFWKGDTCMTVTTDPCHKRKGLYIGNKYCIQRVATFADDQTAEYFDKFMCDFLGFHLFEEGDHENSTGDNQSYRDTQESASV